MGNGLAFRYPVPLSQEQLDVRKCRGEVKNGTRLKAIRESLGFTQEDVADTCEISHGALHNYESGKRNVPRGKMDALAAMFEMDVDELFPV